MPFAEEEQRMRETVRDSIRSADPLFYDAVKEIITFFNPSLGKSSGINSGVEGSVKNPVKRAEDTLPGLDG